MLRTSMSLFNIWVLSHNKTLKSGKTFTPCTSTCKIKIMKIDGGVVET
jgi:hypothetical protein